MKQKHITGPRMSIVAIALAQAFASHAMAQDQKQNQPEDANTVVVTGVRASAQSSVAIKRDAMEVVDSITADDIGKLPDPNVTETMTRIPGVQGYRYGGQGASPVGQGSGVTIRGLSNLTSSNVNGRSYFTAGAREYNLEGAVPAMIAGIDVYKNPSAEHIEGGIGGLVNLRTRNPSDFKGLTGALSIGGKYDDLSKKTTPEVFGMLANRWNLSGGGRVGVLFAGTFSSGTNRSDNNPANGGANYKRIIRGDSAEYATLAKANTTNDPGQAMQQYVGRSDVSFLQNVGTLPTSSTVGNWTPNLAGLTADQIKNVIAAPVLTNNVFEETIKFQRRGYNFAADWRVDSQLRFYVDSNYTYYIYHQEYRGLNSVDGANVQNLQTTPYNITESLANRNLNGGSDDVLTSQRLLSGSFLNSRVTTVGGDEHHPYSTMIGAAGAEWNPTPALYFKADLSLIKAIQKQDNRSINLYSKPGTYWTTNRVIDGSPHQLTFTGPSLSDPSNFLLQNYNNSGNQQWHDSGAALALDGHYIPDDGWFFSRIKFGTRFTNKVDHYANYGFNVNLTTDGKNLDTVAGANGIAATTVNFYEGAPTNFMYGESGYSGGYVVYRPSALLGNQVATAFPSYGIRPDTALVENIGSRRRIAEKTQAAYVLGEFALLDDRLKGSAGVRLVHTQGTSTNTGTVTTNGVPSLGDVSQGTSYNNALPTLNMTYDIAKDFLARFGYGKGMTRADLGSLNPVVSYNPNDGTAGAGNPDLRPFTANSYDFSLERYFSKTNYVAAAIFDKEIKGFVYNLLQCETIPVTYTGTVSNGCTNGQYLVSRPRNADKGYARGIELSGQYFFGSDAGWLQNFGVSGSYTYLKTGNPVNFGTAAKPNVYMMQQPFQSKNNYSLMGMYEDTKLSARLVYTWRSAQNFNGFGFSPLDNRYIVAYGLLDGSFQYQLTPQMSLSVIASNLTNKTLDRNVGEPLGYATSLERQHYENGRTLGVNLRYKFGML